MDEPSPAVKAADDEDEDECRERGPNKLVYNIDWLNRNRGGFKNPLVWDNYSQYPGDAGFIGPFGEGYSVDSEFRIPPHRMIGGRRKGSAKYWIDRFHVDGLRVDAVASMIYRDYSREEGQWIPNQYGGREDLAAAVVADGPVRKRDRVLHDSSSVRTEMSCIDQIRGFLTRR